MSELARPITVAALGTKGLAAEIAKVGTKSDLTLHNVLQGGVALTLVEPTQFPEKLPPLLASLSMADKVLLAVNELSRDLAESVVAADMMGRREGVVALAPNVGEAELKPLLKGTTLADMPVVPLDAKSLRERLLSWSSPSNPGATAVPLDHAFPVKGVGTVALGLVKRGTVKAHDKLRLYPTEKTVEVRSLQVHDVEQSEVPSGHRVGLALKGVEADELSRGMILAPEGSLRTADLLDLSNYIPCRFFKGKAGEGEKVHVSVGLQVVPARVQTVDGSRVQLQLEKPVAWIEEEPALILQLSGGGPGPRLAGRGLLP